MNNIESLEPSAFTTYLKKYRNTICGRHPISVLMHVRCRAKLSFFSYQNTPFFHPRPCSIFEWPLPMAVRVLTAPCASSTMLSLRSAFACVTLRSVTPLLRSRSTEQPRAKNSRMLEIQEPFLTLQQQHTLVLAPRSLRSLQYQLLTENNHR